MLVIFPCVDCYKAVPVEPFHFGNFQKTSSVLYELKASMQCPCGRKLLVGAFYQLEAITETPARGKVVIKQGIKDTNIFVGSDNIGQVRKDAKGKFIILSEIKFYLSDEYLKDISE